LAPPDSSCLTNDLTTIRGVIDGHSIWQLVKLAHERYPQDAIHLINANGPYAEVLTGRNCRMDTESGEGRVLWFRFEDGTWTLKEDSEWVG